MKLILTPEDKKFIIENYSMLGGIECSKKINRSSKLINGFAARHKLRVSEETRMKQMKRAIDLSQKVRAKKYLSPNAYRVNPDIFRDVKTPEAAYILGLLWADGWIYKDKIAIQALKDDLEFVIDIFLKTGKWSKQYGQRTNRRKQMTICTNNKMLREFLENCDYKAKSAAPADKILNKIPEHLQHYWWRGLFDGDGCFYVGKDNATQMSIASSYEQDWSYVEKFFNKIGIKFFPSKRQQTKRGDKIDKSSIIRSTKREEIIKFGECIYQNYENDKIGFPRKYEKFLKIKAIYRDGRLCPVRVWT